MGISYTAPPEENVLGKALVVSRQADCSAALPDNTATQGYIVVTTAGSGTSLGDVLRDNGTDNGTMTIISAEEGRKIIVTDAVAGGTIEFDTDSEYIWDTDGSTWVKIGDLTPVQGAVRCIRFEVGTDATTDSSNAIPADARVVKAVVEVATAYDNDAELQVGISEENDLFADTDDIDLQTEGMYEINQDTRMWATEYAARATISNSPTVGEAVISIFFTLALDWR
uniref:Uncharacterized protein n=1 Tax=viral metagenome TaxID=1070528 RepID=A0A6H1ZFZ8_9ZZZZ